MKGSNMKVFCLEILQYLEEESQLTFPIKTLEQDEEYVQN